jgi:alpha-ketoglutarate-dependent taurine dioxygenase
VRGVDLTRPVMPEVFAEIDAAFCRYGILVFPEQPVTDEQQLAFSRLLSSAASALRPPEPYARSRCLAAGSIPAASTIAAALGFLLQHRVMLGRHWDHHSGVPEPWLLKFPER